MKMFLILVVSVALFGLIGCSGSGEESAGSDSAPATQTANKAYDNAHGHEHLSYTGEAEVGCGMCTYSMDGVQGCVAAVKFNDKSYLLAGQELDAHGMGLCQEAKMAKVSGETHGSTFVAASLEMH